MVSHFPNSRSNSDKRIFISLLLLIIWLPLPLGSNRPWAWAIMEVWILSLSLFWLWKYFRGLVELTPVFLKAKWIIVVWIVWLGYLGLQCLPLPYAVVQQLSPKAAYFHTLGAIANTISLTANTFPQRVTLSVDPHLTAVALLKSISYVLLFILILLLITQRQRLQWIAYTLVFSGLFQAIYGSFMTLSGLEYGFFHEKLTYLGFATGTFINRNHLAGYLVMCLSIGIGLLIAQLSDNDNATSWRQRLRSILAWLLSGKMRLRLYLGIMVIALVLTRSRMGNIAFFTSLLIAGLFGLIRSRHTTRATVILLVSLIVIDVFIVGTWFGLDKVAQRLEQTRLITESRDEVSRYTLTYWQDYFWTGSGLGSFYAVFPHYRGMSLSGFYDHAHNDYLELASETGLVGLILLGSIVLSSLGIALVAQYRRHNPLCRGIAVSVVMTIIAILIHSSVDFNLQIPANVATFVIILALAWVAAFLPRSHYYFRPNSK
ncbi:MAG: O-antigen ligase family protein [Thioploca sp.]|nr:O-antigen ligase family protein [Thioploca sp.]